MPLFEGFSVPMLDAATAGRFYQNLIKVLIQRLREKNEELGLIIFG